MKKILCFACILFSVQSFAQNAWYFDTIYFANNSAEISQYDIAKTTTVLNGFKNSKIKSISIEGHTDSVGSRAYNDSLGAKRCEAVKRLLTDIGIITNEVKVTSYGEAKPISMVLSENRRVELAIETFKPEDLNSADVINDKNNKYTLERLLAEIEPPMQRFCIDPYKDTLIRLQEGTLLYFKGYSLQATGCNCVTLEAAEAFTKSSILLNNLHTMSGSNELVSQAMLYTAFICQGKPVPFLKGKSILAMTPTDTIRQDVLMYRGDTLANGHFNWHSDSTSPDALLGAFSNCGNWQDAVLKDSLCATRCPLFFCKTKRLVKGMFSQTQRTSNMQWKRCRREKHDYDRRMAKLSKEQRANVDSFQKRFGALPVNPESLDPRCIPYWDVLKKYGIKNITDVKKAVEKELFTYEDSAKGVSPSKWRLLDYYVFNLTNCGWNNVDWVCSIPPSDMIKIKVVLDSNYEGVLKIVYSKRRSVSEVYSINNVYNGKYAKNEMASLVFIGVNNANQKPVLQLVDLNDKEADIVLSPKETKPADIAKKLKSVPAWQ